ncbi:unnamed protein product, partial [Porites evermanni]
LSTVQARALICLNNIVTALDADLLGGEVALGQLWCSLFTLAFAAESFRPQTKKLESPYKTPSSTLAVKGLTAISKLIKFEARGFVYHEEDFLEAATGVLRSVIDKLVSLQEPQVSY